MTYTRLNKCYVNQSSALPDFRRGDDVWLEEIRQASLEDEVYLRLECIAASLCVGNWFLLGNLEWLDLAEVCRDLMEKCKGQGRWGYFPRDVGGGPTR